MTGKRWAKADTSMLDIKIRLAWISTDIQHFENHKDNLNFGTSLWHELRPAADYLSPNGEFRIFNGKFSRWVCSQPVVSWPSPDVGLGRYLAALPRP